MPDSVERSWLRPRLSPYLAAASKEATRRGRSPSMEFVPGDGCRDFVSEGTGGWTNVRNGFPRRRRIAFSSQIPSLTTNGHLMFL